MAIIGRTLEMKQLIEAAKSDRPEIVAVYGRRRVGKTYLVNQTFSSRFAFAHSGLSPIELQQMKSQRKTGTFLKLQLQHFYHSLQQYGLEGEKAPENWLDAFHLLTLLLEQKKNGKKQIVFIDELPWLDTDRSYFITAFEAFCNGYASRENILLIVAGSAISWIVKELINNHGGLYGRITREILLQPLNLAEAEQLLQSKRMNYSRYDIARAYMILGGIPYYLNYLDPGLSLPENIDHLFFAPQGVLSMEFERLFSASFDQIRLTTEIVRALAKKSIGLDRNELSKAIGYGDGEAFSSAIRSLLLSGYIVQYSPLQEGRKKQYFKVIDPFCLFYLRFVENRSSFDGNFFSDNSNDAALNAWKGFAFENVCNNHLEQIKSALRIRGVSASRFSFVYRGDEDTPAAQIDLVLERKDNIVDLCEMKFVPYPYEASGKDETDLSRKKESLSSFLRKSQTIQTVLISPYGIKENKYRWTYQNVVDFDDLFVDLQ